MTRYPNTAFLSATAQPWIAVGYETFALEGPQALKVEVIARKVQKSKSSFYHHFADLDVFITVLLEYHLQQTQIIAQREAACENILPELVEVLVEVKVDLLFNRQLRVNRHIKRVLKSLISLWVNR